MKEVDIRVAPIDLLGTLLPPDRWERLRSEAARGRELLAGRVVWNVSATAEGGGVAEMLHTLLSCARGAGVDTRWWVLDGDPEFFSITKRIHNALHGAAGDGHLLGAAEHAHYERVLAHNLAELTSLVRPGDLVLLHDPQTAGLVDGVRAAGARVVWRCHIGRDTSNAATDRGWAFLRRYLQNADAVVFSRGAYAPPWMARERVRVIAPSIDPFSPKNRDLDDRVVSAVLARVGLVGDGGGGGGGGGGDRDSDSDGSGDGDSHVGAQSSAPLRFTARDGSVREVRPHTGLMAGPPLPSSARLVLQVSRWDRLKDMGGVLSAFAELVVPVTSDVHLVLAGPDVSGVSDDPEGAEVLAECRAAWSRLPEPTRDRCHLACIPMDDVDENAVIVNALQRHATVIVQKSLQEGFGLTVTEAMWKSRPVLASAVGGIQEQIVDGEEGLLLPDPHDLPGFARLLLIVLADPVEAQELGRRAHQRVTDHFLGDRHLIQYLELFADLLAQAPVTPRCQEVLGAPPT